MLENSVMLSCHLRKGEKLNIFLWPWDNHGALHLLFLTLELPETIVPYMKLLNIV